MTDFFEHWASLSAKNAKLVSKERLLTKLVETFWQGIEGESMNHPEQTDERKAWLSTLQQGDLVCLETLLGKHTATVADMEGPYFTVRILPGQDAYVGGWEVPIKREDGIGKWQYNIIYPFEPVLGYIGDLLEEPAPMTWETTK